MGRLVAAFCLLAATVWADVPRVADVAQAIHQVALDPNEAYHVRDLLIQRGDVKLYLTEGTLCFAAPVLGKSLAAVFTTEGSELGDAEAILMPSRRSERASLLNYAKTPNLDEHFDSALLFFTDDSRAEIMRHLDRVPLRRATELARSMAPRWNPLLSTLGTELDVGLVGSLLDRHSPASGLFYAILGGRSLGVFDVLYDPARDEPLIVGQSGQTGDVRAFQTWVSCSPRGFHPTPTSTQHDYRIEATIASDLSLTASVTFDTRVTRAAGRVIPFDLSTRLTVTAATVDGETATVFQHSGGPNRSESQTFLVVSEQPLDPAGVHRVVVQERGSVIDPAGNGAYLVQARNLWFPYRGNEPSQFDLFFRVPRQFQFISTGELADDHVVGAERGIHRRTAAPVRFAGFNIGTFEVQTKRAAGLEVECYAPTGPPPGGVPLIVPRPARTLRGRSEPPVLLPLVPPPRATLATDALDILSEFRRQWGPAPVRHIAISPLPGFMGQGFAGLIYLSTASYGQTTEPAIKKDELLSTFFNNMLLAHELAHQWWGNLVTAADYRSEWIMEAMANYSALERVARVRGSESVARVLAGYRDELLRTTAAGTPVDSTGPLELGYRLRAIDPEAWRVIIYDKGTWVMTMLRERIGEPNFQRLQRFLIQTYANQPLDNEQFRRAAAQFVPAGEPDRNLEAFFDTWVYGTGIPRLSLKADHGESAWTVRQNGVEDDFIIDVPLRLVQPGQPLRTKWLRLSSSGAVWDPPPGSHASLRLPDATQFLFQPASK